MNAGVLANFGITSPIPADLHPVMEVQECIMGLNKENITETGEKLLILANKLGNFDDITTNICDFAQRNTKYTNNYVDLCVLLAANGSKFVNSLFEVIKPCNGHLFRGLYLKKIYTKDHIKLKISMDRKMHYFFLPEFNSKKMITLTRQTTDITFLRHFSKVLNMSTSEVREVCEFGYKKKSVEYVLKYDESKLLKALLQKHSQRVHQLVEPAYLEIIQDKVTPIDLAAYYGSIKCFNILMKEGEQITRSTCSCAIHGGNSTIIDKCRVHSGDFSQALMMAIEMHREKYYKIILEKTQVEDVLNLKFDFIIATKNYPVIWTFFLLGFDSSSLSKGNTILHMAVLTRQFVFSKMTSNDQLMINKENLFGFTPLGLSVGMGYFRMSKMLIENGAHTNIRWNRTETLIDTAFANARIDIATFLVNHGALISPDMILKGKEDSLIGYFLIKMHWPIDFAEMPGNTTLHRAILDDDIIEIQNIIDKRDKSLLDKPNDLGFTPFHMAIYLNLNTIAAVLISRNCNVNTHNILGETPLMCATRNGVYDICEIMINMGADINYQSIGGISALHVACMEAKQDICALLIVKGADKEPLDIKSMKPVDYARPPNVRILFA